MTFEHWITNVARAGDNPRGDFIRDTRETIGAGRTHEEDFTSLLALRSMMRRVSNWRACEAALKEAGKCWREYERWRAPGAAVALKRNLLRDMGAARPIA